MSIILSKGRTIFVSDTNVTEMPKAEDLVEIACQAAHAVRRFGHVPRVALLAYSTFGYPMGARSEHIRDAVALLDERNPDFEYEGEMAAHVALRPDAIKTYPFMRLSQPANVLIMPAIHSASISTKMAAALGGATVIGPLLVGLTSSVQIAQLDATAQDIVNLAAFAAYNTNG
jgi:malate dehydrogenase (oxaloacetate-decarboxylating)(NADP+)